MSCGIASCRYACRFQLLSFSLADGSGQVQQQMDFSEGDFRQALEPTMQTTVEKFGVVHFGPLLEVMIKHMEQLQGFMKQPRSLVSVILRSRKSY